MGKQLTRNDLSLGFKAQSLLLKWLFKSKVNANKDQLEVLSFGYAICSLYIHSAEQSRPHTKSMMLVCRLSTPPNQGILPICEMTENIIIYIKIDAISNVSAPISNTSCVSSGSGYFMRVYGIVTAVT